MWFAGWLVVGGGIFHRLLIPLGLILGGIGLFAGLLLFEILAYIGLRKCRFANRGRMGGTPSTPGDSAEEVEKKEEARR